MTLSWSWQWICVCFGIPGIDCKTKFKLLMLFFSWNLSLSLFLFYLIFFFLIFCQSSLSECNSQGGRGFYFSRCLHCISCLWGPMCFFPFTDEQQIHVSASLIWNQLRTAVMKIFSWLDFDSVCTTYMTKSDLTQNNYFPVRKVLYLQCIIFTSL